MPSNLATGSRNVGLAWKAKDAAEFNRLMGIRELHEMFVKNLHFLVEMKGYNSMESFAEAVGVHEVYMERGFKGVMSYHIASVVAVACGTNVERMFMEDLSQDHFLKKQAERTKSA